ncbi:MAG: glycogen synthase GlgA [Burkholderiaceae bacterium]
MALNILAVSSEAFPLAKTGGLGDAVSGLAQSLGECGVRVTLLLPAYPGTLKHVRQLRRAAVLRGIPGGEAVLLAAECPELKMPVLLLKNDALYDREGLYATPDGNDYDDNAVRFAALAHAAARIAQGVGTMPRPDIVHAHDWHAALAPLIVRQLGVEGVKTVLTLHNVAFQGIFPMALAGQLGIAERYCNDAGLEFWGQLNFLKAGIRCADLITVVSRNYAREILTPEFGCGLEGVLADRRGDLVPIPNGIDTALWNPEADEYLRGCRFGVGGMAGKATCKHELQQTFGLAPSPSATVLAMGSRLTSQKMADVAVEAIPLALDQHQDLQACIIGQGEKKLEKALAELAQRYPGRCSVHIGFDEAQAHLLHAGADILLHGSRFEPFGLTPLYSMRYGTVPIGSRVGGMADTILDPGMHRPAGAMRGATGILFEGDHPRDMALAIDRAMALRGMPEIWNAMQVNGMRADFSWAKTAPSYLSVYQSLRPDVSLGRIPERYRRILPGRVRQPAAANPALAGYFPPPAGGSLTGRLRKDGRTASTVGPEATAA